MPEEPEQGAPVEVAVAFPVIFDLDFLPYFPSHKAFVEHALDADGSPRCERCHMAAFHPEELDEVEDFEDQFCETGRELREAARVAIHEQHHLSLQN